MRRANVDVLDTRMKPRRSIEGDGTDPDVVDVATASLEALYERVANPEDAEHAIETTRVFRRHRAYYRYLDEFRPETSAGMFRACLGCGTAVKSAKAIVQATDLGVSVTNEILRDTVEGLLEERQKEDKQEEEEDDDFGKALFHVYRGAVEAGAVPDQATGQLILDGMLKEKKLGLALKLAEEFRLNDIVLTLDFGDILNEACNHGMSVAAAEAASFLDGETSVNNLIGLCKLAFLRGTPSKARDILTQIEEMGQLDESIEALNRWPGLLYSSTKRPKSACKARWLKEQMESVAQAGVPLDVNGAFQGLEEEAAAAEE